MKKLDIFDDKEFQSLELSQKTTIVNNYFDKKMADDEFRSLDSDAQTSIRKNFADAQLDFSVGDTVDKVVGFFTAEQKEPVSTEENTPAPVPAVDTPAYKLPTGTITPEDMTTTRPFIPDADVKGKMLSPDEQDKKRGINITGTGEEYENPDAQDWELGKRLVNRTNELTANAIQGTYNFLGNLKTPAEYLGITTEAQTAMSGRRADWFKKAADDLSSFVYENNKLDTKPTHSWGEVKKAFKAGGVFDIDSWQELLNYGGSEAVVSAPDMAEMVATLPLYYAARQQESAEKRAKNEGRKEPTAKDYLITAPTTIGSIILDRFALKATTADVVDRVGKKALDGKMTDVVKTIAKETKDGFIRESSTEAVQNPLEQFGEEVGTKHGLSSLGEYADVTLAGFAAGGVMGTAMSGATATGTEVFNAYTKEMQEAQRDRFIVDAYKRNMLGEGKVLQTDDAAFVRFQNDLDAKIKSVQNRFENLVINHPDVSVPVEAIDNVAVQEQFVNAAEAKGLDTGDQGGLNAIDKGFKELEAEIGGIEGMQPKGLELETMPEPAPIIEKPVSGQPEPEAKTVEERKKYLKENQDILSVEEQIAEFDDIQRQEADALGITVEELNRKGWKEIDELRASIYGRSDSTSDYETEATFTNEDAAEAVQKLFNQKEMDGEYKKMSAKEVKDLDNYHVAEKGNSYPEYEYTRAYALLPTEKRQKSGVQGGLEIEGTQNALFDSVSTEEYIVPEWANGLVNDSTRYEDLITAVTDAKNGKYSELSNRVMDALHRAGSPHLEKEQARYNELSDKFWGGELNTIEEQELEALTQLLSKTFEEQENGTAESTTGTEQKNEGAVGDQQGSDGVLPKATEDGAQQGRSESTSNQNVPEGRSGTKLTFDTTKVYSTKGINSESPNNEVGKKIQKDVARYVGQLAKALGYDFDVNKNGKKLSWNGVSANLAPAGGDMTFRLFKPESDVGVYVSLSYQPDTVTDAGGYDRYRLQGVLENRFMWRTTIKGEGSRSDGGNNRVSAEQLTEPSFINDIIKQVDETEVKRNDQAERTQGDSGPELQNVPDGTDSTEPRRTQPGTVRGADGEGTAESPAPVSDATDKSSAADDGADGRERVPAARSEIRSGERAYPSVQQLEENFELDGTLTEGGAKTRFRNNVEAIKIVQKIQDYNYRPTLDEKKILSQYVGWGGIPNAFYKPNGTAVKGWEKETKELKELLSDEQYAEARRSTQDAHYTAPEIINAIWSGVKRLGFKGGKVLEPSVGVGNFFGLMPGSYKPTTKLYGVELDGLTSTIAKTLYPRSAITNKGLQDVELSNDFSLVIGNPPFGSQKLFDKKAKHLNDFSIHNYFFAKSMDALEPGGILAMVVSNGLMDAGSTKAREYIGSQANLVGAIRLPNNAFSKSANTEVTTDIIFLQKRYEGQESNIDTWRDISELNDTPINRYFVDHKEMLLGRWGKYGTMYRGDMPALIPFPDASNSPAMLLPSAINSLPQNIVTHDAVIKQELTTAVFDGDVSKVRVGAMFVQDDVIYRRELDKDGEPQVEEVSTKINSKDEEVAYSSGELEKIKGMIGVVSTADELRILQLNSDATNQQLKAARMKLNSAYDAFVKKNGFLNNAANARLFEDDIRAPFLLALEKHYDKGVSKAVAKKTGQLPRTANAVKADIFTKRTQTPYAKPTKADSAQDALTISLGEYGNVNLPYMQDLTGKSEEELIADLEGFIYEDPHSGWVTKEEFLSGNVKQKLKEATDPRYIDALKQVIPKDIEAVDISVTLGASWVPKQDMADFVTFITGDEKPTVALAAYNAKWSVTAKVTSANASRWGTARRSADDILQQTMNLVQMEVKDNHGTSSQPQWVLNTEETTAVQEKQEQLKEAFKEWIWKSAERRERLGRIYNNTFNTKVLRKYDGTHIKFVGKSNDIDLRQHQKNGVWRALSGGTVLSDHTVGTGKTFTTIASIMEMRRTGKAKKALVVVPNHLTGQWGKEWLELYPSASILVPSKKDFTAKRRKTLMSRIATGDYDAIIIAHSQLTKIQNDIEFEKQFIKDEIARVQEAIDMLKAEEGKSRSVKDAERSKERLQEKMEKLNDLERDDNFNFSELGIDALAIDEAHEFKNLAYTTGLQKVAGLGNPLGSKKAFDLFVKSQHLLEKTGGNNLLFLTGTPISNTIAEMFTMQRYLSYSELKKDGLDVFDAWVKHYAEIVSDWELTPSGKYKLNTRLSKFNNMPELITEYKQFADVVTRADIPALPIPKIKGGKPMNVVVDRSPAQAAYIGVEDKNGRYKEGSLVYRSENLPKGKPKKGDDNMLAIMGEARKVALDMRLIDPAAADNPDSKVNMTVAKTVEIYKKWNAKKGVQLIFCDLSTPKGAVAKEKARIDALIKKADAGDEKAIEELEKMNPDELDALNSEFSVYDDIKAKLIKSGVPENAIAFIHDANTELQKQELFGKVKAGTIRVLLGSTSKMGAGMNVQDKLVALHHLDVPWRPSDLEQREGRIIRQGNEFYVADPRGFEVEIYRYATKNTLDSMMWQTIEAKANFIEQLRAGNLLDREVEDVGGEAMSAAEMKALSSGNPLILEDMKLSKDIKKLEALKKGHDRTQFDIEGKIKRSEAMIAKSADILAAYAADVTTAKAIGKEFSMVIEGKSYDKREEAGSELINLVTKAPTRKSILVGEIGGFDLYVENLGRGFADRTTGMAIVSGIQDYEVSFTIEEQSYEGLSQKIVNQVRRIANEKEEYEAELEDTKKQLPDLKEQLGEFKSADELDRLKLRKKEVLAQLRKKDDDKTGDAQEAVSDDNTKSSYMRSHKPASLSSKEKRSQMETEHYARVNGYDEAGVNYIPTYAISGLPARPLSGTIKIGGRNVTLPTLDEPMNADSLRIYLSDIIGNRLYEGKIKSKSALGKYQHNDSAFRVKNYSAIEIMAHEMAHYLEFYHGNKTRKAADSVFRKEIMKNKEEVKALSYTTDPKQVINEGFAEFVRLWLTNYNAVSVVAPGMVKDFEAKLAKDKALNKKMLQLQEGMHQYYFQGEHAMLRSKRGGELNPTARKIQRSQAEIGKDLRQKAIDKLHSIKRVEAAIRGDVPTDAMESAYKTLQLVNGASSIMYSAMNIGVPTVQENGDISYGGKPLNEIFAPAARVSEERVRLLEDYFVAKRAGELMEQGRENLITADEIRAGLKLAEVYPEFVTIFEEYQAFNDGMLDFYVGMNLITSSQRENFQEFNKNYVPFHRIVESVQYGEVPPGTIGRRLTGGTHSLGNIMENIINGIETNIKEALISRGKSVFYDMLEQSGMGGVYATRVSTESKKVQTDVAQQAKAVALIMSELGIAVSKDGMIISGDMTSDNIYDVKEIEENLLTNPQALSFWTHGHKPTSMTGYIDSAIINDQVIYFEVNDPGIVDAITSFRSAHFNTFVQGLMTIKNVMTWNITNNPLFYLTNFMRDTVSAGVLSKNGFVPVMSSIAGMAHFLTKSKVYKEFMASGAGYGTRRTTLGSDIDAMTMLNVNRGFDILGRVVSAMEYGADVFEYGTRVGDFALAQKRGSSNMQSAFEAREVSTDFAIKGSNQGFTGFMATVPFMKAAINGLDKTARRVFSLNGEMKMSNAVKFRNQLGELQNHKIKIYATGGMLMGLTLGLWLQNRDDERYKKLTRDKKMMYWHFFVGDKHIQIPRPYDIGFVFSAIPELTADGIYEKHGEEALKDFLWGMKTMFSIGDVSGMFQPILDDMTNTNWTGSPIIPYNMRNMDDLSDQYFSTTPLMYKKFGELTGASPIKTQHYVDGYLGLTAKMIEETTENLLWNADEWGERPFAQDPLEFLTYRFRGREVEPRSKYSEKYYDLMEKAAGVKASFDAKKREAIKDNAKDVKEYMSEKEKQAYVQIDKMMRSYNKTLTQIKLNIEMVSYDKSLTKAQKEQKINDAYTKKTELFKVITENIETELKKLEDK